MKPIVLAFAFFAAAPALWAQATALRFTDPDRREALEAALPEIERIFDDHRRRQGVPGVAFGVVIDGDLVLAKGLGVRNVASDDPVTPDTVFRIASMTKSFTALAILKLRDEGKLSLEDPAAKWIPELADLTYPTRDSEPIRVRHLLTHGAGLPEDNPWADRHLEVSEEELTRWLEAGLPLSTSPGTAFEYSNYGFALLGRIVSRASGEPYRDYVEQKILAPLGMSASTFEPSAVPAEFRAKGYRRSGDDYVEEPPLADGAFGAIGGLLTSARDLGRYVAYQLAAFPPRDDPEDGPVRRSSRREMQQPWRPSGFGVGRSSPTEPLRAAVVSYGYGLSVSRTCDADRIVAHSGGLPGFGSYMRWLPEHGVGIFAMANLTYQAPAQAVVEAFEALRKTGALRPRELPPSEILRSTRQALLELWRNWDDQVASEIAADNLFQDRPAAERREEIDRMKEDMGACSQSGEVRPENLLRGAFRLSCEQGFVDVAFTLAPTAPPKVQDLSFVAVKPLQDATRVAAESLADAIGEPSGAGLGDLVAPSVNEASLREQLDALGAAYGACRLGETLAGDGAADVTVRLDCARGKLDARLKSDPAGKLTEASFRRPADAPCVP